MSHFQSFVLLVLILAALVSNGRNVHENSVDNRNTNSPLSTNATAAGIVIVQNLNGVGITNVRVRLGYFSSHNSPVYRTDGQGKAVIPSNFSALVFETPGVAMTMFYPIDWPCLVRLPTRLTAFKESKDASMIAGSNSPASGKKLVWVRNRDGQGIKNLRIQSGDSKHPGKEVLKTDINGKAELGEPANEFTIKGSGFKIYVESSKVEWPCEITLPTTNVFLDYP